MCTFLPMPDTHSYGGHTNEWLTIGEAASYLGLSITTLRRYDATGRLPAVRLPASDTHPGQRRYLRSELDSFLSALSAA